MKYKSSIPEDPMFNSDQWTEKIANKVHGRWIEVGYLDARSVEGISFYEKPFSGSVRFLSPKSGNISVIDSPTQIIATGPKATSPDGAF